MTENEKAEIKKLVEWYANTVDAYPPNFSDKEDTRKFFNRMMHVGMISSADAEAFLRTIEE